MENFPIISVMILLPLAGVAIIALFPNQSLPSIVARTISILEIIITTCLFIGFNTGSTQMQFVEKFVWISSLNVNYHLGVDGLGLLMVAISAFVVSFSIFATGSNQVNKRLYYSLLLLLLAGLLGTFTAQNFIHWFLFWELSLVPSYFLVKLWGGRERIRAATIFFIYTLVGSILMFICFLAIYSCSGTFEFSELANLGESSRLKELLWQRFHPLASGFTKESLIILIFIGILSAFLVKIPLMPFHSWLPITYYESPSFLTMILTGVMSKMGLYGLIRIAMPIFPEQFALARDWLIWLAVITIVISAATAMTQNNLKKIFAYSSINHLGYCMLAIFAYAGFSSTDQFRLMGMSGVILQMVNHSINAATLFYFVGLIENRSNGISDISAYGGIRKIVPILCGLMGITMFASLGLPGLNGFVGEFLIFASVFYVQPLVTIISVFGLLFTAIFILKIIQKVFCGELNNKWSGMADLTRNEILLVTPSIILIFTIGIYPAFIMKYVNATITFMR
ncbi:MAG: complex I subunit 4 family protein [Limisphaerales bacterium]